MKRSIIIAALAATLATATTASAGSLGKPCTTFPKDKWAPLAALEHKLKVEGFSVRSSKIKNACAEVYALDSKGAQVELFLDPATGDIVGRQ